MQGIPWLDSYLALAGLEHQEKGVKSLNDFGKINVQDDVRGRIWKPICRKEVVELMRVTLSLWLDSERQ